jgi:hypothetical protein
MANQYLSQPSYYYTHTRVPVPVFVSAVQLRDYVTFYAVVGSTDASVTLQEVETPIRRSTTGLAVAVPGKATGKPFRRKIRKMPAPDSRPYVEIGRGHNAWLWNGIPIVVEGYDDGK